MYILKESKIYFVKIVIKWPGELLAGYTPLLVIFAEEKKNFRAASRFPDVGLA